MKHLFTFTLLLFLVDQSYADRGKFFVGPQLSRGSVDIDKQYSIDGNSDRLNNTGIGISGGYKFNSNILIEVAGITNVSDNILGAADSYNLSQRQILLGYSIKISNHLIVVPKVGFSDWTLKSEEGKFLNPGEEETNEIDGQGSIWLIDFEIPVNQLIQLHLSYSNSNFDFGKAASTKFGVKFEL